MPEASVKLLMPNQEEEVFSKPGFRHHYKVITKYKPVPLRLRLFTTNGMNHTFIHVSQILLKPSKDHCENSFLVKSKKSLFILYGDRSKSKIFKEEAVYFTVESHKESNLIFIIGFHNESLSFNAEKQCASISKKNLITFSFSGKDIKKLSVLFPSPKTTSRCLKRKSRINLMTKREKINHREQVFKTRNDNEEKEIARKFLLSKKNIINQWYDVIIEKKRIENKMLTNSVFLWASFTHLQQIAKYLYKGTYKLKKKKEKIALRFHSAIRIRMAIQRRAFHFSSKFNERFYCKLSV